MPEIGQLQNPLETPEPAIHVIPEEFYGAAARARIPASAQASASAKAMADRLADRPAGKPTATPAPAPVTGSKAWLVIPILALAVLAVMGVVVWQLVLKKPAAKPADVPKTAVTLPTPEPTPSVPTPETPAPTAPATTTAETEAATTTPLAPEPAVIPPAASPSAGASDSDADGLSDVEETLYGTDKDRSDSDGDGFSDSVEVINLYNPAGFKPTKLIEAGLVTAYAPAAGHYEILYPTGWTATAQGGGDVVFGNPQNQPVSVTVEDNPSDKSILDWYLEAHPGFSPAQVQQFFTKSGLEGVRGPDGLTAYVSANSRVYVISYVPGLQTEAPFRSTFQMMVNSFTYKP